MSVLTNSEKYYDNFPNMFEKLKFIRNDEFYLGFIDILMHFLSTFYKIFSFKLKSRNSNPDFDLKPKNL